MAKKSRTTNDAAPSRSIDHSAELRSLHHLETMSDNLGTLASSLGAVANAIAASVIAQHGSAADRAKAIKHLKGWFWESDVFSE